MAEMNGSRASAFLKLGILVGLVAAGTLLVTFTPAGEYLSREGVGRAVVLLRGSPWAPVIFVSVYAATTALAMPGSILTLTGGAAFGLGWGTVYNTVGANIGANLAFGVARLLGRAGVERMAGNRLEALDRATESHGFHGLLTLRLIPAVPFNALNFGSGLTAIRWPTYALATLVGIFPGTVVYTMFADALLAGSQDASREAFVRVLVSGLLLVLLSLLPTLVRRLGVRLPGAAMAAGFLALFATSAAPVLGGPAGLSAQELPDPAAFTRILAEVVRRPRVDYARLGKRQAALEAYLSELSRVDPATLQSAPKNVRLAFWINAYNACMLERVADHYPIRKNRGLVTRLENAVAGRPENSVWQIENVFTEEHCEVAGAPRSQDEIEHGILRPMGDPRIHFAVNCAALSCPTLQPEAYAPDHVDEQLDRAVRAFVQNPAHFRVERDGGTTIRLNKVLDWFKEDFGGTDGLRSFLAPYLPEATAKLILNPTTRIEFFDYDWTLNDVER